MHSSLPSVKHIAPAVNPESWYNAAEPVYDECAEARLDLARAADPTSTTYNGQPISDYARKMTLGNRHMIALAESSG